MNLSKFKCSMCKKECECGQAGDENYQNLWNTIANAERGVAIVKCPYCLVELIQCCYCDKNLGRNDSSAKASAMCRMCAHVRKQHKQKRSGEFESKQCHVEAQAHNHTTPGMDVASKEMEYDTLEFGQTNEEESLFSSGENKPNEEESSLLSRENDCDVNMEDAAGEEEASGQFPYTFEDFKMFDNRKEEEKAIYRSHIKRISQNQIFFYQQSKHMFDKNNGFVTGVDTESDKGGFSYDDDNDNVFGFEELNELVEYDENSAFMSDNVDDHDSNHSRVGGWMGLVARSSLGDRENIDSMADAFYARTMFTLFSLLTKMSGILKIELMAFMKDLFVQLRVHEIHHTSNIHYPTTPREMRNIITEGANSIMKNFPAPRVFEIDEHACVDLKEVILIHAGFGAVFNFGVDRRFGKSHSSECDDIRTNTMGLNGTKAMSDLIEDVISAMDRAGVKKELRVKTSIGYLIFWSDSFLRCFIKQKENSVWILTVTICPPEDKKSCKQYTHVLAIGRSNANHTTVAEHYMQQASELMKGFDCYFGNTNRIERVSLGMLVWNADRPENQCLTHTLKEGDYGKITSYAVKVSEDLFPSCIRCFIASIREIKDHNNASRSHTCNKCCNWSFATNPSVMEDGQIKELQENDRTDKNFPKHFFDNPFDPSKAFNNEDLEEFTMEPELEGRESGSKYLRYKKQTTEWMLQAVRTGYFGVRVCNWGKAQAEEFLRTCNINYATALKVINKATGDKASGLYAVDDAVPKFWKLVDCFSRFKFPNLPMHGLGHGIIPDLMAMIHQIFTKYGMMTKFYDYANPILDDIAFFRLDYCKTKVLPKKAWVAENSFAFGRLMSYLYGSFFLNYELRKQEEGKIIIIYIKCMLNAFQTVLSILMTNRKVDKETIDKSIRLFMSSSHFLHKRHGNLDKKKDDEVGPGQTRKKKTKTQPFFESQEATIATLTEMIQLFGVAAAPNQREQKIKLKSRLMKFTQQAIVQKLVDLGTTLDQCNIGNGRFKTKEELFRIMYKYTEQGIGNVPEEVKAPKTEKMCWNKGNWLSFLINISSQIEYLGSLRLIWYVTFPSNIRLFMISFYHSN